MKKTDVIFQGHRVAAALWRARLTGQEAVRRVHKMHFGVRADNPAGHSPHLPGARLLQGEGRPGPGEPLQRHEGLQPLRPRGRLLPGLRIHRRPPAHAGYYLNDRIGSPVDICSRTLLRFGWGSGWVQRKILLRI